MIFLPLKWERSKTLKNQDSINAGMVIRKIKHMLSHDEVVETLQNKVQESIEKVESLLNTVKSQQEEQAKLTTQVLELHKNHKKLSKQLEESTTQVEIASEKIGRVMSEILLFKPKIEKELSAKFETTLQAHLDETTKEINIETSEHKKTQELALQTQEAQEKLLVQVEKLSSITSSLNAKDFELSQHAKQLHLKDQEKLQLMKRVDDLEKLLAKMKRK